MLCEIYSKRLAPRKGLLLLFHEPVLNELRNYSMLFPVDIGLSLVRIATEKMYMRYPAQRDEINLEFIHLVEHLLVHVHFLKLLP